MTGYPLTIAALLLSLAVYIWSVIRVGGARRRTGIKAPAVAGDPEFERHFRVQQNTVEQLIVFLPLLTLAAVYWGDLYAGIYGLVWSVGRFLYITAYSRDADKRGPGFILSGGLSLLVLLGLAVTHALHWLR